MSFLYISFDSCKFLLDSPFEGWWQHSGKCPDNIGHPMDAFLTMSPVVFIGCVRVKKPAHEQEVPLGLV
jgi:hypothetical protein